MPNDHFFSAPKKRDAAPQLHERAMDQLLADLAQQAPDLLRRMQLDLPLPRPTLKLIRTLARLARDDGASSQRQVQQ